MSSAVQVPRRTLAIAGVLSLQAAVIHVGVAPEHFAEWWGYGTFFVVAAAAQLALFWSLARRPRGWVLQAGIWGSLATMLTYLVSRTAGIPLGPAAGVVEDVNGLGVAATIAEAMLLVIMCGLLAGPARSRTINALAVVGVALWAAALGGLLSPPPGALAEGHHHGGHDHGGAATHESAPIPYIPESVRNAPRPPGMG
jgi:hypothetical protein